RKRWILHPELWASLRQSALSALLGSEVVLGGNLRFDVGRRHARGGQPLGLDLLLDSVVGAHALSLSSSTFTCAAWALASAASALATTFSAAPCCFAAALTLALASFTAFFASCTAA